MDRFIRFCAKRRFNYIDWFGFWVATVVLHDHGQGPFWATLILVLIVSTLAEFHAGTGK